ncbi:hypothetical protein KKG45_11245 [bacterium]|nr:hypothetical protein [bacterium]MBU1073810.1 hypothetical protein [bacterium]MBU1675702.1 hypothetical protein [bacterium]
MIIQVTLMTCHKGVDLHAETAERVMRDVLPGGAALEMLHRAEFHTFWQARGEPAPESVERLLTVGRFFNPNKHHFAHFRRESDDETWFTADVLGGALPGDWPGEPIATDLPGPLDGPYDRLLGGAPRRDAATVDVCTFPLGETGPLLSGVVWRMIFEPGTPDPEALAARLTEARGVGAGLLVNPHMQGWLVAGDAFRTVHNRQGRRHGRGRTSLA